MQKILIKGFLLTFLSLFITMTIHGQAALFILLFGDKVASEKFHMSLDIGANFSSLNGYDDGKSLTGLYFGLGTHLKLSDNWYLAPEFKPVSTKGAGKVSNPIVLPDEYKDSESESDIKLNYLEIPVLGQYRMDNGLYFSAGPQISFRLSAKQFTSLTLPSGALVDVEQDLKDQFKSIDYSFPFEIGYALSQARGGKGVDIRLRYTHGLGEVFEESTGLSANHSTFQLFLSFPFIENGDE